MDYKKNEIVLVYDCVFRKGGDVATVMDRDKNNPTSYLLRSMLDEEFTFWVEKEFIKRKPFMKPKGIFNKFKEWLR